MKFMNALKSFFSRKTGLFLVGLVLGIVSLGLIRDVRDLNYRRVRGLSFDALGWIADVVQTCLAIVFTVIHPELERLRRGLLWLAWLIPAWFLLSIGLWCWNIFDWENEFLFSAIGLLSVGLAAVLSIFAGRILLIVAIAYSITTYRLQEEKRTPSLDQATSDLRLNTLDRMQRRFFDFYVTGLRWFTWVAIGETLFFIYWNMFPGWNNIGVLPLFFSALLVVVLLSKKLDTKDDRKAYWGYIRQLMLVIVALCSLSFWFPETFRKAGELLNGLQKGAASETWFPVTALLIIFIAIAVYGSKTLLKHTQWLMIGLVASYIGYVAISAVWIKHNTPLIPTVFLGTAGLVLVLAAIGLMMPKGDGSGKRMAFGVGLAGVTCAVLLLGFAPSQDEQYVDQFTGVSKVFVATDPVTNIQIGVRGPKAAKYAVDPNYGAPFVPWTSLTREEQDRFRANEQWVDEFELDGLNMLTGGNTATYTLKGGTP